LFYKYFAPTALTNDQVTTSMSLLVEFVLVRFIAMMTQVTGIILILLSIGILIYWLATGRRSNHSPRLGVLAVKTLVHRIRFISRRFSV
jgi:hypothetical protein